MPEEKSKISVGLGQAGDPPAGSEVKAAEKPAQSEVGGRHYRETLVICPHCCHTNDIIENTHYQQWYRCWYCGGSFHY